MTKLYSLLLLVLLLTAGAARADESAPRSIASSGLCGLSRVAYPVCAEQLAVAATAGYGYTESVGPVAGGHHRLSGALGVGIVPLPWLAVALRFDGRLDLHPRDARGDDFTGIGEPRLFLRGGHALASGLSLGGEAVIWMPGGNAPSVEPKATTVDLKLLVAQRLRALPLTLLANLGARIDQSGKSAPDLARLRPGDRVALGVSDSHALLIALGASGRIRTRGELFGEVALDLLVGSDAPPFAQSPLRLTVGGRMFLRPSLALEGSATATTQQRPSIEPTAGLVPIEPRISFALGVRYAFDLHPPPPPPVEPPVEDPLPQEPRTADVAGVLVDEQGAALPDVRVVLRAGELTRETVTDGEGRYAFAEVPVGRAELESTATGFEALRWELEVTPNMAPIPQRALTSKGNIGTLRVLTRTFTSEPLAASVVVRDRHGKRAAAGEANAEGLYELDLPPGEYVVTISAKGYRPHRREVRIERYGVAILNVDLRAEK
jgi:hypothetical protein